ncbi:MAG: hypothetical protein ACR2HN_06930 [Tepidiformaceae bacterium]
MNLRFWQRPPRQAVMLDPVQAVAVRFLLRHRAAPVDVIVAEGRATLFADRESVEGALRGLAAQGVIAFGYGAEDLEPFVSITPLGRRLRGKLPRDTRSALAVYV